MSLFWWIVLTIYIIGWVGFSVTITRVMAADGIESDDHMGRILTVVLGMMAALFWPLVIPGGWVYKRAFSKRGGA